MIHSRGSMGFPDPDDEDEAALLRQSRINFYGNQLAQVCLRLDED